MEKSRNFVLHFLWQPCANLFYSLQHTQEKVIKRLNEKGNDLTYEVFVALMSEVLPKDRDFNALCLVMQISYQVVFQLGWSFMSNFKRFISENFADEAVSIRYLWLYSIT